MQEQNTAVNVVDAVDRRPQLGGGTASDGKTTSARL